MTILGESYLEGSGGLKNYVEGEKWLRAAINAGDKDAKVSLGRFLIESKRGIPEGLTLLKNSLNDPLSDVARSVLYTYYSSEGKSSPDMAEAITYLTSVAANNHFTALDLAKIYEAGKLVAQDLVKAYTYFNLAAESFPEAVERRDKLEKILSAEDIEKGQRQSSTIRKGRVLRESLYSRNLEVDRSVEKVAETKLGVPEACSDLERNPEPLFVSSNGNRSTIVSPGSLSEIDKMEQSGNFVPLGQMQGEHRSDIAAGMSRFRVRNETGFQLFVIVEGQIQRSFQVSPGGVLSVDFPAGPYKVAARVSESVRPYLGRTTFENSTEHTSTFFLEKNPRE